MTEQPIHPMQPSAEQFGEWLAEALRHFPAGPSSEIAGVVARLAYAAGADAELEACVSFLAAQGWDYIPGYLRAARRPKPPSLKQQALVQLSSVESDLRRQGIVNTDYIRRALEALPDEP